MNTQWKFGMKIAAERGVIAVDFPDLIRVEVDGNYAYALVSVAQNYILIQDTGKPPLYRIYPFDGHAKSLIEFIADEAENPSTRVTQWMEKHKRLFKKWEHIYSFSPWMLLHLETEKEV